MLDLNLFKNNRYFTFSCFTSIFFYISTIALILLLSLFMQYLKEMSPQEAGYILLVQPLFQAVFSPIVGKLSDNVEARKLVSIGIIITLIGIVPFIFFNFKLSFISCRSFIWNYWVRNIFLFFSKY